MRVYNPKGGRNVARAAAATLLANISLQEVISARLAGIHMSADEALSLLADQARGDIADLMDINTMGFNLDLKAAKQNGKTKLIKRVKQRVETISGEDEEKEIITLDIELHDAQTALRDILRAHGRLIDRKDITSGGKPIGWKEFISGDNGPDTKPGKDSEQS